MAAKWRTESDSVHATVQAVAKAGQIQQAQELLRQHRQFVMNLVTELKSTLGPPTYAKLDAYIRATSTVRAPTGGKKAAGGVQ